MRVFCDSAIFIYLVEGAATFKQRAAARLAQAWNANDVLVVSDVVRLECRVMPIRNHDLLQLGQYDLLFSQPRIIRTFTTTAVFDRATDIRAAYNFRLGDSLNLAAAVDAGCSIFLTNDHRLQKFQGIPIEVLS
jgi:predicted nucleic acid-binding protein